jgi:hypothetical protein
LRGYVMHLCRNQLCKRSCHGGLSSTRWAYKHPSRFECLKRFARLWLHDHFASPTNSDMVRGRYFSVSDWENDREDCSAAELPKRSNIGRHSKVVRANPRKLITRTTIGAGRPQSQENNLHVSSQFI